MPFFGKWRRKDIYQNSEDRTPTTLTNYFLNGILRHRHCSKSFVAIPEKGGSTCASRRRQSRPYASGCAECKQLLLDQLQQPAFLRFIASSSNELA